MSADQVPDIILGIEIFKNKKKKDTTRTLSSKMSQVREEKTTLL